MAVRLLAGGSGAALVVYSLVNAHRFLAIYPGEDVPLFFLAVPLLTAVASAPAAILSAPPISPAERGLRALHVAMLGDGLLAVVAPFYWHSWITDSSFYLWLIHQDFPCNNAGGHWIMGAFFTWPVAAGLFLFTYATRHRAEGQLLVPTALVFALFALVIAGLMFIDRPFFARVLGC